MWHNFVHVTCRNSQKLKRMDENQLWMMHKSLQSPCILVSHWGKFRHLNVQDADLSCLSSGHRRWFFHRSVLVGMKCTSYDTDDCGMEVERARKMLVIDKMTTSAHLQAIKRNKVQATDQHLCNSFPSRKFQWVVCMNRQNTSTLGTYEVQNGARSIPSWSCT